MISLHNNNIDKSQLCVICKIDTELKDHLKYLCYNCNFYSSYCLPCNKAIDVLLDSSFFKCNKCNKIAKVTVRESKINTSANEIFQCLFINKEDSCNFRFNNNTNINHINQESRSNIPVNHNFRNYNSPPTNNNASFTFNQLNTFTPFIIGTPISKSISSRVSDENRHMSEKQIIENLVKQHYFPDKPIEKPKCKFVFKKDNINLNLDMQNNFNEVNKIKINHNSTRNDSRNMVNLNLTSTILSNTNTNLNTTNEISSNQHMVPQTFSVRNFNVPLNNPIGDFSMLKAKNHITHSEKPRNYLDKENLSVRRSMSVMKSAFAGYNKDESCLRAKTPNNKSLIQK